MSTADDEAQRLLDEACNLVQAAVPKGMGGIIFVIDQTGTYVMNSNLPREDVEGLLRQFLSEHPNEPSERQGPAHGTN